MFKRIFTFFLSSMVGCTVTQAAGLINQGRGAQTCADPSLSVTFFAGYSMQNTFHVVAPRWLFVNQHSLGGADWQLQGALFRAWQTPQDFTFPMYRLFNPVTTDWIIALSTDGTVPVVSGFDNADTELFGYAYSTQVCGSVPLIGASLQSKGDHWYTIDTNEHSSLLAAGWVDAGTVAFVLPLNGTQNLHMF
uniref:DUF5648 domain-containing protein n=1 Tax=Psilocybe cubensis TaxID=181762 RepID=A0A8H8CGC8_PSICU